MKILARFGDIDGEREGYISLYLVEDDNTPIYCIGGMDGRTAFYEFGNKWALVIYKKEVAVAWFYVDLILKGD